MKIHPDLAITKKSMKIIENFVDDMFGRIMQTAKGLAIRRDAANVEINHDDIAFATDLELAGMELGKYARIEAGKSLQQYMDSWNYEDSDVEMGDVHPNHHSEIECEDELNKDSGLIKQED